MTDTNSNNKSKKQPAPTDKEADRYRVTATSLYVREGPGKNHKAIGHFGGNDIVESLESNASGKWMQVRRLSDGLSGWCSATYLTRITSTSSPIVPNDDEGEAEIYRKYIDPEMPSDLIPTSGNHPLHQLYYNSVFLTKMDKSVKNGKLDKAIDITDDPGTLYELPAEGVILKMEQSWYLKGVTLGQLSHSLALAPGESTRIAMVDWEKRTRGSSSSTDDQASQQSQTAEQNSAIGEISHALTRELQHGESTSSSEGESTSKGGTGGLSLGGLFSIGGSANNSTNHALATSVSRSSGIRDMTAESTKKITARTQQLASATSSRRATLVKETFESEKEQLTTRVVTNYNHMHALSIQYYDVVQAYKVKTRPYNYDRCLFIPMKVVKFTPEIVKKYRAILAAWAPSSTSGDEIFHNTISYQVKAGDTLRVIAAKHGVAVNVLLKINPQITNPNTIQLGETILIPAVELGAQDWRRIINEYQDEVEVNVSYDEHFSQVEGGGKIPPITKTNLRLESIDFYSSTLDKDDDAKPAAVLAVNLKDANDKVLETYSPKMRKENSQLVESSMDFAPDISLKKYGKIDLEIEETKFGTELRLDIIYRQSNQRIRNQVTIHLEPAQTKSSLTQNDEKNSGEISAPRVVPALEIWSSIPNYDLIDYLDDNALYYSQAIWANADALTLSRILANYSYPDEYGDHEDSKPLGASLDPIPVAMTGNYLGFRWHFTSDDARNKWLKDNNFEISHDPNEEDPSDLIVSLPSGGVFAEAVLGRFNSAEKLDITRFWNWQDSPIPILPPEIAALQAGSHNGGTMDLTPGQTSAAPVQFASLSGVPGDTSSGLESILRSISAASIFRDMSGADATSAALQNAARLAKEGGAEAAQQATTAMENIMKHQQEMAKIGLEAAKTYMAPGASLATTSTSKVGAALNMAQKLDDADASSPDSSGPGGGEKIVSNVVSALKSLFGR